MRAVADPIAVTVADAAHMVGLSQQSVRAAIDRQELRAKRLGVRVLIPVGDLRAWVESLPDH